MQRKDLDKLTSKQDFLRPPQLTDKQEKQMQSATSEERQAFITVPSVTKETLQQLEEVSSNKVLYIAKTIEHPYVSKHMKRIIEEITEKILKKISDPIIIIVSATRMVAENKKANKQIASTSTHTKGEAVDIAAKFMKQYFPNSAKELLLVIEEMQKEQKIYFSNEENITSFWHIARKP